MKRLFLATASLVILTATAASATHVPDCTVTSAAWWTYNTIDLTPVGGPLIYDEERGNPFGTPIPGSGMFFGPCAGECDPLEGGQGSWIYEETNGIEGLQRGGPAAVIGEWFPPGCDQNPEWQPTDATVPCLLRDVDPLEDETCGHGPDRHIL